MARKTRNISESMWTHVLLSFNIFLAGLSETNGTESNFEENAIMLYNLNNRIKKENENDDTNTRISNLRILLIV